MTSAQLFLETIRPDGKPERQLKQYEGLKILLSDPVNAYLRAGRGRGTVAKDRWGITFVFPEDAPGGMPHITEETKVCKDITRWREFVHAPDIEAICQDGWEDIRAQLDAARAEGKIATILMGTGMFEQSHFLMGFEDMLVNLHEHPTEMHELIDYILEYRMTFLRMIVEKAQPDAILSHDDWGAKDSLFMAPETWREFFKEPYRKFYGYMREHNIIAIHHADSYLAPIVEDMAEIGIQVWQGALPENNIPQLQEQLQGRMTLMGGVGAAIDRADAEEAEIRAYVQEVLAANCPGGHYIPCITYGLPGTVFPHVDPFIDDEIDRYNALLHLPSYRPAAPVRRLKASTAACVSSAAVAASGDTSLLERIASALKKGQSKRLLKLCRQALEEGIPAQSILSDGLVAGMTQLGDDFSANRAFVPEMLLAARCMSAATEVLKSSLVGDSARTVGRVCLGTVKGDMHDIGKNLVKIMMEGNGLEVVDLGVDVSAETFVDTAVEQNCDIIACSALLTTTMPEMRRVVELARERGIRNQVKIMVGGAPISQAFCDEIGADLYTDDAASAAREAVALLS